MLEDLVFLKELKNKGFKECYALCFTDSHLYYKESEKSKANIYKFFRNNINLIKNEVLEAKQELNKQKVNRPYKNKNGGKSNKSIKLDFEGRKIKWNIFEKNLLETDSSIKESAYYLFCI